MSKRKYNKQLQEGWTNMDYFMWELLRSCTTNEGTLTTYKISNNIEPTIKFHIEKEDKNGD